MMIPPRLCRLRQCHSFGLHQVYFHGNNLLVTVTKRGAEVDEWVNEIIQNYCHVLHNLVVGLDIEWHPCFEGEHNPATTLQLYVVERCLIFLLLHKDYVGERCLIFLLLHKDYIPPSLISFLVHPRFPLLRDHGLTVTIDLRRLAQLDGSEQFMRMGLKKMDGMGKFLEEWRNREVTLSNWDAKNLTFRPN